MQPALEKAHVVTHIPYMLFCTIISNLCNNETVVIAKVHDTLVGIAHMFDKFSVAFVTYFDLLHIEVTCIRYIDSSVIQHLNIILRRILTCNMCCEIVSAVMRMCPVECLVHTVERVRSFISNIVKENVVIGVSKVRFICM